MTPLWDNRRKNLLRNGIFKVYRLFQLVRISVYRLECITWEYNNGLCNLYSTYPVCENANEECWRHTHIYRAEPDPKQACGYLNSWHYRRDHSCNATQMYYVDTITNSVDGARQGVPLIILNASMGISNVSKPEV